MNLKIFCICLFLLVNAACRKKNMGYDELLRHTKKPKNGLLQSIEINKDTKLDLQYQPSDILVYNDYQDSEKKDTSVIRKLKDKYEMSLYFKLLLSSNGKEMLSYNTTSLKEVSERINTLAFHIQEYIYIITDKNDTIQASACFSDRTFGMNSSTNVLLGFSRKEVMNETINKFKVNIDEMGFDIGDRFVVFDKQKIENCPQIKF